MSRNYQLIAKTKDISEFLLESLEWPKKKVVSEIGITNPLFNDIMETDPVSINIKTPTVKKLEVFISKHEAVLEKEPAACGVTRSSSDDPFPDIPKNHKKAGKKPDPPINGGDPLAELDKLEKKFASRGYKLEARIIKIQ